MIIVDLLLLRIIIVIDTNYTETQTILTSQYYFPSKFLLNYGCVQPIIRKIQQQLPLRLLCSQMIAVRPDKLID